MDGSWNIAYNQYDFASPVSMMAQQGQATGWLEKPKANLVDRARIIPNHGPAVSRTPRRG